MKLLYLANLRMPTPKAYGIQIAKNCEAFAKAGVEVELLVPFRPNPVSKKSEAEYFFDFYGIDKIFKFTVLPAANFHLPGFLEKYAVILKELWSARKLAHYARQQNPDIIFSRDVYSLFFLSFSNNKKPKILELHRFSPFKSLFYRRIKNRGAFFVTTTKNLAKQLLETGIPENKIITLPNGVDIEMFNFEQDVKNLRAKLGLPIDRKIVLYSGNLYKWKGVDTLFKTARMLDKNIFLAILGGLKQKIENFKDMPSNIIFLGKKPYREVPFYLKSADVFILPNTARSEESLLYTSPLKMFEYMASQKPIVASKLPSLLEILNERNAILVEPDNPAALAEGIAKALKADKDIQLLTAKAYRDVQNYSLAERVKKILSFADKNISNQPL